MDKIVLATNNKHKINDFKNLFKDIEIQTSNDVGFFNEIVEDGKTFYDNALIKAKTLFEFLKEKNFDAIVIADDSGLCVNALDGRPGVYSARYAGNHDVKAARSKLLEELNDKDDRSAYYECVLVAILPNGKIISAEGKTYGHILEKECGTTDFGFDRLFYSDDLEKPFGLATDNERNRVSHRGKALQNLKAKLSEANVLLNDDKK